MSAKRKYYECLPEARETCVLFGPGACDGTFGRSQPGCLEANRAVLREQARKEAAGYGVGTALHDSAPSGD